jgi:RloB-like protein
MSNKGQRPGRTGFSQDTNLRRRANTRTERRSVLIVTNGVRTEVDYFDALRKEPWVTADKVTVKFQSGGPIAVVLRAAEIRDDNAYDEAWAVCDVDEFAIEAAIAAAEEREVGLALSLPSFEAWLILHLSEGCPGFNNATQAGRHLKSLLPGWDKTGLKFSDFRAGVFDAAVRAKRLGDPPDANPSTAVWRLIESLRNPAESN